MVAKKRLLAGLASLTVMGIALAGCGSPTNNSSNTPKDEKVTITYMHRLPDKKGMTLVNDIVAKWNKDNPNIQVKATKFDGAAQDMIKKLATDVKAGSLRHDPFAMLPFCGYNMGDYWKHWIEIGQTLDPDKAPKIFNVNWFRKDDEGNFLWPGFGDNMRVLDWIVDRCEGKVDAQETAIGYLPYAKDINREGLDMTEEQLDKILDVDKDAWEEELKGVEELYAKFGDHLPKELADELATVKANLEK